MELTMYRKLLAVVPALFAVVGMLAALPACPAADGAAEGEGE